MSNVILDECINCGKDLRSIRATREGRHKRLACSRECWSAHRKTPAHVFWRYVDKNGPVPGHCSELGPCWIWTGKRKREKHDYGLVHACDGTLRQIRAHRFSWQLHNGTLDPSLDILHLCDNPPCVNPSHLKPGTHKENMADMASKGRNRFPALRGESNPLAKFTEEDVVNIRNAYSIGFTQPELMFIFAATQASISNIVNGRIWTHVGGPIIKRKKSSRERLTGEANHNSKLNPDKVRYIRKAFSEGVSLTTLVKEMGVGYTPLRRVVDGTAWRHVT